MTIIDALLADHATFCEVFAQIERVADDLKTVDEIKLLGNLVEGLLKSHSEAETELAYSSLDHLLEHRGQLDLLYHDHKEIDSRFERLREVKSVAEARRLLLQALQGMRDHFDREERTVFRVIEKTMRPETLAELSEAWMRLHRPAVLAHERSSRQQREAGNLQGEIEPTRPSA